MAEQIRPFRAWCQRVLPLVYDDSLSYYELLCKVTNKLNEVIGNENGLNDSFEQLTKDFEKLKVELNDVIEEEAGKVIDQYVSEHNLISTVNNIGADPGTGNVTLKASDVGAIANVNESVKTNNIAGASVTGEKIALGAITEGKIASGAVTGGKIATGAVSEGKITDGAVSNAKLGANAVSEGKIASGAVTGGKIATGAVSEGKIADGAITNAKLAIGSVGSDNIVEGAVISGKIGVDAVIGENIADGAVSEGKIANGAVNAAKLAAGAVSEEKIMDGAVSNKKLGVNAVNSNNVIDGAITASKIANGSINSGKIGNSAIDERTLADDCITNAKIKNNEITPVKLNGGGTANSGKLLKVGQDGVPFWGSGEGTVTAGVESVNGKDGVVTLTASDVGAIANRNNQIHTNNLAIHIEKDPNWLSFLKTEYPNASDENVIKFFTPFYPGILLYNGEYISFDYGYDAPVTIFSGPRLTGIMMSFERCFELNTAKRNMYLHVDNSGVVQWKAIDGNAIDNNSIPLSKIKANETDVTKIVSIDKGGTPIFTDEYVISVNNKKGTVILAAGDVGAIPDGAGTVNNVRIANEAVSSDKLADNSVTTSKIVNLSVTADKLSSNSVTATKIVSNAVTSAKVASGAITEDKIGAGAVTEAKIADGAVTGDKLADMAVTLEKIDNQGAENAGKVLIVQNNGDVGLGNVDSGDKAKSVTISNGRYTFVVTKNAWGTVVAYSNSMAPAITTTVVNVGKVNGDMFPNSFWGNFEDGKNKAIQPNGFMTTASNAPNITFGTATNARFMFERTADACALGITSASGSVNNICGAIMFIPGV